MTYDEWEQELPEEIRADSLWKMKAYRLALFLGDLSWEDVTSLTRDPRTMALSDQLYRAVGSIGANLAEGYSRGTGKDRAHFYDYALGSAREARDWYYKARFILGDEVIQHRMRILAEMIRLLLTMIPQQRYRKLSEPSSLYDVKLDSFSPEPTKPSDR